MLKCDAPGCIRGLIHLRSGFADPCQICAGKGELHLAEVARLLNEDATTLAKLLRGKRKMRVKTCRRILDKVARVVWPEPEKQPDLFA